MILVQIIYTIPLSQVADFGIQDKQLASTYWKKSVVECILSKSSSWLEPIKIATYKRYRSRHRWFSVKKDVLRNFAQFPGKNLCQRLFFNKAYY